MASGGVRRSAGEMRAVKGGFCGSSDLSAATRLLNSEVALAGD